MTGFISVGKRMNEKERCYFHYIKNGWKGSIEKERETGNFQRKRQRLAEEKKKKN